MSSFLSLTASTNSLWLLSLTTFPRLKSIAVKLIIQSTIIHERVLLDLIWHITFTLVILTLEIPRLIHFFLHTLICIEALLRLILMALNICI